MPNQPSASTNAIEPSATPPPRSIGGSGSTGASGGSSAPVSPSARAHSQASSTGRAEAPSQIIHGRTARPRRRTRKKPSSAVRKAGSSSVPTSRRTAQSGSTLRIVTIPSGPSPNAGAAAARSSCAGPAASIAITARRAARPNRSSRSSRTAAPGRGPRSPDTPSITTGSEASAITPCSLTVKGSARRIHCAVARLPPGRPASTRTAFSTVRWSASGAASGPSDHGTTHGLAARADAMSPEHDHRVDAVARLLRPRARPREPVGGAGGGHEHERLAQLARAEHARQLEQRGGARQLGQAGALERVAMREDDDPAARQAGPHADDGLDFAVALARDAEGRALVAVRAAQRVGHAVGERGVVGRSGAPVRERARQLGERVPQRRAASEGALAVERVGGQLRRRGRRAVGEREGDDEQRDERRQEGSPIYPNVEHGSRVPLTILDPEANMADRAPRILLVDDEQPIQTLLSFPLQRDGYEVVQASDGREALARFSEQQFDLVVLDLMLPRMDGLEVCKRLRAKGSTVPIIMLTAKSEEIDKVLGLELGADDYITKPFSMREFRSRVKAALRRAGMAREGANGSDDEQPIDVRGLRIDSDQAHRHAPRRQRGDHVRRVRDPHRAGPLARAASSRATCCSRACGATRRTATRGRSTSTSGTCARRSRPTPRSPSTCSRCAGSATGSGTTRTRHR